MQIQISYSFRLAPLKYADKSLSRKYKHSGVSPFSEAKGFRMFSRVSVQQKSLQKQKIGQKESNKDGSGFVGLF